MIGRDACPAYLRLGQLRNELERLFNTFIANLDTRVQTDVVCISVETKNIHRIASGDGHKVARVRP